MITVTLLVNNGSGLPKQMDIADGTTLRSFLDVSFEDDPDDYTIKVRANGASVEVHEDYVLQDGDRISMAPSKVDGAAGRGPGTNEEQIASLRDKVGEDGVSSAEAIVKTHAPEVIALAYKMTRNTPKGLPKNVERLIGNLSDDDAKLVRDKLTQAQ